MANVAIELDLGACPGKQNEKEIVVIRGDFCFLKKTSLQSCILSKRNSTNNKIHANH